MKTRAILFVVAACAAWSVLADAPIKFIGTTGTGAGAATDITNPAKWGDGVSAISDQNDYIIDNGKYCGFGGDGTFIGRSLTLGAIDGNSGNLEVRGSGGTFNFGSVVMNKGEIYAKVLNAATVINASVTVNALEESPYSVRMGGSSGSSMGFEGSFHGSGVFRVTTASQTKEFWISRIRSNMSDFSGKILVGPVGTATTINYRSPLLFGDTVVNGEIVVNPCGVVGPCGTGTDYIGEFSAKKLTLHEGSTIRFGVNATTGGTIRVTQALMMPATGKVTLDVAALPDSALAGRRHPILIVPAGTGLSTNDFVVTAIKNAGSELYGKLVVCTLDVDASSPDCEVLYLVMAKYTCLKTQDSWGASSWTADYSTRWYGVAANTPLNPDTTYISYNRQMVTPTGVDAEFGGKKLVFSYKNSSIYLGNNITVNDLNLLNGCELRLWALSSAKVYGNIMLTNPDPTVFATTIKHARNYAGKIYANISGAGGLQIMGSNGRSASDNSSATIYLGGTNTSFSGRLAVTNTENDPATNLTLRISDVRSLGGAMEAFAYNGIGFSNWSRLQADASLNIAEPTRGVYFNGGNYVNIPDAAHTLTLASQTTLAGTLVKEGSGTLALGGMLKFTSSQSDTPAEGTNILQVSAGRIKPVSKTGADGLAIKFASGTGLRLSPLAETDAEVLRYGLYDVKWAAPFDLTATGGKLDVALDLPADRSEIPFSFSFGVCTVPSAAADALAGNITLPSIGVYNLSIEPIPNGDGTVTFRATYAKRGFIVTFK